MSRRPDLECASYTQCHSIEEQWLCLFRKLSLGTASLRQATPTLLYLDFVLDWVCISNVTLSMSSYMSGMSGEYCSLEVTHHLDSYFFLTLLHICLSLKKKGYCIAITLGKNIPEDLIVCILTNYCVSWLLIYYKKRFLWQGHWCKYALICGCNNVTSGYFIAMSI